MLIKSFPNCCGIDIIVNFGNSYNNGLRDINDKDPTEEEVYQYLKDKVEYYKRTSRGMLMATIDHDQKKKIGNAFRRARWKKVAECYHLAHNSIIYTYIKIIHKAK